MDDHASLTLDSLAFHRIAESEWMFTGWSSTGVRIINGSGYTDIEEALEGFLTKRLSDGQEPSEVVREAAMELERGITLFPETTEKGQDQGPTQSRPKAIAASKVRPRSRQKAERKPKAGRERP
jgi:hypothetical protein